jgi:hypothetical protein
MYLMYVGLHQLGIEFAISARVDVLLNLVVLRGPVADELHIDHKLPRTSLRQERRRGRNVARRRRLCLRRWCRDQTSQ